MGPTTTTILGDVLVEVRGKVAHPINISPVEVIGERVCGDVSMGERRNWGGIVWRKGVRKEDGRVLESLGAPTTAMKVIVPINLVSIVVKALEQLPMRTKNVIKNLVRYSPTTSLTV
jgi:hypothetical protein